MGDNAPDVSQSFPVQPWSQKQKKSFRGGFSKHRPWLHGRLKHGPANRCSDMIKHAHVYDVYVIYV